MREDKRQLRQRLRQNPRPGDDHRLCRHVLGHPWFHQAKTVMAYAAMPGEANLGQVLRETLEQGKRLVLPRCEPDGTMTARLISDLKELVPGTMGISEPQEDAPKVMPEEIDLVLVPGMAFDPLGGRLGRGKGYYDRFLAEYPGKSVGICYHGNLLEAVPMEGHDKTMDAVVTDQTIIQCERRARHV